MNIVADVEVSANFMKTIKLPIHNIVITLTENDLDKPKLYAAGTITSNIKDNNKPSRFSAAVDTLESVILGHAVAGLNVEASEYLEGLISALDKIVNEFGA
ncbi:MAG: hypothetical protein Q7T18_03385 [Sedimentisphaerales bacterium]|nr:hypothetical protein [Sedimentisphaerales bacterium]